MFQDKWSDDDHPSDDEDWFQDEDMWSDLDEDEADDDLLQSDSIVDMEEISELARRKVFFHRSCMIGGESTPDFDVTALLLEAELGINNHEYKPSLICAKAAEMVAGQRLSAARLIEMICLYQMGDRNGAEKLMHEIQSSSTSINKSEISPFLMKKFGSTCEVLTFMPQLLSMLASNTSKKKKQF